MEKYTKQTLIEAYLGRSLTTAELAFMNHAISLNSSYIQSYTGRVWREIDAAGSVSDTSRYFDGNGLHELFIDDFTAITKIELLDAYGSVSEIIDSSSDYILYPLNKTTKSSIYLRANCFNRGAATVKVTGKFGSGTVPDDVVAACTVLSAKLIVNGSASADGYVRENIEGYSYEVASASQRDVEIKQQLEILDRYKKIDI